MSKHDGHAGENPNNFLLFSFCNLWTYTCVNIHLIVWWWISIGNTYKIIFKRFPTCANWMDWEQYLLEKSSTCSKYCFRSFRDVDSLFISTITYVFSTYLNSLYEFEICCAICYFEYNYATYLLWWRFDGCTLWSSREWIETQRKIWIKNYRKMK